MLKAFFPNDSTDRLVFIPFDDIRRIELDDREPVTLDSPPEWTSATITTFDNQKFTTGILGIEQLSEHFKLDLEI